MSDDSPRTAIKAYIPKPIPCPIPVITPCNLPPVIVFLITTAKLGPGDMAPIAQIKDNTRRDFISIYI